MKIHWSEVTGYVLIVVASSFWGGSATLGKTLMQKGLSTAMLMQTRSLVSALILITLLFVLARKHLKIRLSDLPGFILLAIPGLALVNVSYYYAIRLLPIAIAVFIQFTAAGFIFIYGMVTKTERPTRWKLMALALSIAGTYLMVQLQKGSVAGLPFAGIASAIVSMLSYAFYVLVSKRLSARHSAWTIVTYGYGIATIFWCLVQNPFKTASALTLGQLWVSALLFAVVSTCIPFSLFLLGLRRISPTGASIASTMETVTASLFAFLILGETLSGWQALGAGLILAALFILIGQSRSMPVLMED